MTTLAAAGLAAGMERSAVVAAVVAVVASGAGEAAVMIITIGT